MERQQYRLMNLGSLADHIEAITLHAANCTKAIDVVSVAGGKPMSLQGVTHDMGLASFLQTKCHGCGKHFRLRTSSYLELCHGQKHFDINIRAVWGEVATGGGAFKLNEQLATMGVPGMSSNTFTKIESEIGEWWGQHMRKELLEAGQEEKQLAIERNDYHEGVPAITVVGDGGWSKRTHKHTYDASGGVAILVGAVTGKLLHVGVRNRTCVICTRAETYGREPRQHDCGLNWRQSSTAMENDIILEGFNAAEATHGVRYMRYIQRDGQAYSRRSIIMMVPTRLEKT